MPNLSKRRSTERPSPLTLQEVAEQLACSADHVRNLIAIGHLACVRVPGVGRRAGRVLVMQDDLNDAIRTWRSS